MIPTNTVPSMLNIPSFSYFIFSLARAGRFCLYSWTTFCCCPSLLLLLLSVLPFVDCRIWSNRLSETRATYLPRLRCCCWWCLVFFFLFFSIIFILFLHPKPKTFSPRFAKPNGLPHLHQSRPELHGHGGHRAATATMGVVITLEKDKNAETRGRNIFGFLVSTFESGSETNLNGNLVDLDDRFGGDDCSERKRNQVTTFAWVDVCGTKTSLLGWLSFDCLHSICFYLFVSWIALSISFSQWEWCRVDGDACCCRWTNGSVDATKMHSANTTFVCSGPPPLFHLLLFRAFTHRQQQNGAQPQVEHTTTACATARWRRRIVHQMVFFFLSFVCFMCFVFFSAHFVTHFYWLNVGVGPGHHTATWCCSSPSLRLKIKISLK